jgi:Mg-chelatase subunit ChlD
MNENESHPGAARPRAYLLDAAVLCALLFAVGLAWGFDLAVTRTPNAPSRPTLFAHDGRGAAEAPEPTAGNPPPVVVPVAATAPQASDSVNTDVPVAAVAANVAPNVDQVAAPTPDVVAAPPMTDVAAAPPSTELVRTPPKPEHEVEFFHVKSRGNSVAFVVDCSGSMSGSRFDRARVELINAVCQLADEQRFYIIFFNQRAVPLFPGEPARLVDATIDEQERCLERLPAMDSGGGTNPEPALREAIRLDPDVIYLLSDGAFRPIDGQLMQTLRTRQIHVNTIAFEDPSGQNLLQQIAQETQGTFRHVPRDADRSSVDLTLQIVAGDPKARAAALQQAHRQHREIPGLYMLALRSSEREVEQAARKALQSLAGQLDFGPKPGVDAAEKALCIVRWRRWLKCRPLCTEMEKWTPEQLNNTVVTDSDPARRMAARIVIGHRHLTLPRALFAHLGNPDPEIREELVADLVLAVPASNPGLRSTGRSIIEALTEILKSGDATSQQSAARALDEIASRSTWSHAMPRNADPKEWQTWLLDELEVGAAQQLELAKKLFDQKKFKPALARFREIEKDFPGTKSAQQAHDMAEAAERALAG